MFSIEFDTKELERKLPRATSRIEAAVWNSKQTCSGISVFKLVDEGRGAVRPKGAKALRIPMRGMQYLSAEGGTKAAIFRAYARPTRPQKLREKAFMQMRMQAPSALPSFELSQRGLLQFVNAIARVGLQKLRLTTPRGSGPGKRLANSYTLTEAK